MRWLVELQRRGVIKALVVYVFVAWVGVEISAAMLSAADGATHRLRAIILVALAGCPAVAIFAWRRGAQVARRRGPWPLLSLCAVLAVLAFVALAIIAHSPRPDKELSGIAVLPFSDLSATGDYQYLADGIAEEIRNRLVAVPGLDVAARSSAFAFRQRRRDVREIAELLRVDLVLDGSLRKAGEQVRVSLQLVDGRSGFEVWTGSFDAGLEDIFALQDQIAAQIVAVVAPDTAQIAAVAPMPSSFGAYDLYLLGRHNWRKRDVDSLERALAYFDQSIARDPQFARSHTGRADSYLLLAGAGARPAQMAVAQAEAAVHSALQLEPLLGDAHASLGLLRLYQGNINAAEQALREALSIAPDNAMAHMWLGLVLQRQAGAGPREALDVLRTAQNLDPLDPTITQNLAGVLARLGRSDEAIANLRMLATRGVHSVQAELLQATLYADRGLLAEALVFLADAPSRTGDPHGHALFARTLAALGQPQLAQRWLRAPGAEDGAMAGPHWLDAMLMSGAENRLRAALQVENRPPPWQWWNGLLNWRGGDLSAALESFDLAAAVTADGEPELALIVAGARAAVLRTLGDADSAIGVLTQARERGSRALGAGWNTPRLQFALAVIAAGLGDEADAEMYLDQAVAGGWREIEWAGAIPGVRQIQRLAGYAAVESTIREDLQRQWTSVAGRAESATASLPR